MEPSYSGILISDPKMDPLSEVLHVDRPYPPFGCRWTAAYLVAMGVKIGEGTPSATPGLHRTTARAAS
jgi:hypothetical protein